MNCHHECCESRAFHGRCLHGLNVAGTRLEGLSPCLVGHGTTWESQKTWTALQPGATSSASGILSCADPGVVLPVFWHCELAGH